MFIMNNVFSDIVLELKEKIIRLSTLYKKAKNRILELEENNKNLNLKIENNDLENKDLEEKYNKLHLAKTVLASSEDSHEAKIKINRIVREIDNCIALLNR